MQYKFRPKSDVVITQMVPSTKLNDNELSNYIMKPILSRNKKELRGFVALQIPVLRILRKIRNADAFLRTAEIILTQPSLNGL